LKILRINIEEQIQKWLQLLLDIFGHSVLRQKHIDASPHTNYLPNF
jgi:hypothetical protein